MAENETPAATPPAAPAKRKSLLTSMAERFEMEPKVFMDVLKATAFRNKKGERPATNEEVAAFLTVAQEHNLNPFKKEIYAFRGQDGGIHPIVPIDGWCNIINSHPALDGIEFLDREDEQGGLIATVCTIHRKDRKQPTVVAEYLDECKRNIDTWKKWPRRMLRHKALIQCARVAFGFSGIIDEDEGERIRDVEATVVDEGIKALPLQAPPDEKTETFAGGQEGAKEPASPEPGNDTFGNDTFGKDEVPGASPPVEEPPSHEAPDGDPFGGLDEDEWGGDPPPDESEAEPEPMTKSQQGKIFAAAKGLSIKKDLLQELVNDEREIDPPVAGALKDMQYEEAERVIAYLEKSKAQAEKAGQ